MIFDKFHQRNLRKENRKRSKLGFESLEDRKLMAADVLMSPSTAPMQTQMMGHSQHEGEGHGMSMHETCTGHTHQNPALMALVTDAQATHVATASGNWSDPAIWQNGQVPREGARVVIAADQTVTIGQEFEQEFKTVRIDGTLRFANNVNTQLKVDTLVSTACGRLEIGTQANPIARNVTAKVIFADDGTIDRAWDPTELSRGALLMGTTEIHGAETTDKLTATVQPRRGATSIQLSSVPTNWKAGNEIIITGTQGATSDEIRTIASIDGSTVNFSQGLALDHVTPKAGLDVYVANKTRNVQLSSENDAVDRRGHIMFLHTQNVTIDFAEFNDLGRTDKSRDLDDVQFEFTEDAVGNEAGAPTVFTVETNSDATNRRGRYAIHFHRASVDPNSTPATVNGSVVDGSPGWGFVNHSSHVNFTSNVAYGVWGAAYYTEAGDEIGTFDNNIAIRSVNPRDPVDTESREIATDLGHEQQEFGNSGDGFWLSGHLVSLTNNVSSGNTGHGIIIWSDGLVEHDLGENSGRTTVKTAHVANGDLITGRSEIPVWWAPLAEISNNEVSNATIGVRTRYIHSKGYLGEGGSDFHATPNQAYVDTLNPVIDGLKVWGSREGVMLNYSERMSLRNAEIIGIGEPFVNQAGTTNVGVGLDLGNDISRGSGRIENLTIEGFGLGMFAPRNEQWVFDNLSLSNTTDMLLTKPTLSPRTLTMSNVNFGDLDGTAVAGTASQRQNIAFLPDPEFTEFNGQPFAFLMPDQITIDGQQIYADYQNDDFVPLPETPEEGIAPTPSAWIGLTNQQLQNLTGLTTGGNITPSDAQSVDWISGGRLGALSPASTRFPELFDMTNGGFSPEDFPGGPTPELTGNRLEIDRGETVVLMNTNLNTTDTNTGLADLRYTASQVQNGFFAHRDSPATAITDFTQAEVNGGVILFVHDGSDIAPDYRLSVSDGTTTTGLSIPMIVFNAQSSRDNNDTDGTDDGNGNNNDDEGNSDGGDNNENRAPIANDDSASLQEGSSVEISVLSNDTDPDGDDLSIADFTQPSSGTVTAEDGILVYAPNPGFSGTDSFSYNVTDGELTNRATVSIEVEEGIQEDEANEIGYSSTVRVNHRWQTVSLPKSFDDPVVVAGGVTRNGSDQGVVRIRNVTSDSFQIRFQEWNYLDGRHAFEDIGFIVVESGTHELPGGIRLEAGTTSLMHEQPNSVEFETDFANAPVVISQVMTFNGGAAVTDRLHAITESGFRIQMNEEEAADHRHNRETIGWIAIAETGFVDEESPFAAVIADDIHHRPSVIEFGDLGDDVPVILSDMQTRRGRDPATVRHIENEIDSVRLFIDEERSADNETRHVEESVGVLAFRMGSIFAATPSRSSNETNTESEDDSDDLSESFAEFESVLLQPQENFVHELSTSDVPAEHLRTTLSMTNTAPNLSANNSQSDLTSYLAIDSDRELEETIEENSFLRDNILRDNILRDEFLRDEILEDILDDIFS